MGRKQKDEYHCPYTHMDLSTTHKNADEVIKKHKEAVEQKENKSKLNALLTAVPDHVKVVKVLLTDVELALPHEGIQEMFDSKASRSAWLTNVLSARQLEDVTRYLAELHGFIREEWLQDDFDTQKWRRNLKQAVRNQEVENLFAGLEELDAKLFYTTKEKIAYSEKKRRNQERGRMRLDLALKWGYVPGQDYLDKLDNIVCKVDGVQAGRLVVKYGRKVKKYSKDTARQRLQEIPREGNESTGSGSGKKRKIEVQDDEGKRKAKKHKRRNCWFCRCDITMAIHIKCAECACIELCLDCFARGEELDTHKNTHSYYVKENVNTPIFEYDWGADEELALLEAIKKYGYGNWEGVGSNVSTKTAAQCASHYLRVYLQGPHSPRPDPAFDLINKKQTSEVTNHSGQASSSPKPSTKPTTTSSHKDTKAKNQKTTEASGVTGAKNNSKNVGAGAKNWGGKIVPKNKTHLTLAHQVGYLMERGDFEVEWDNDAEDILADMEFTPQDSQEDINLKLKVLEIYNSKLDQREERNRFVLERGLLQRPDLRRSKYEQELDSHYRIFARFHSHEDHQKLIKGLLEERSLQEQVSALEEEVERERKESMEGQGLAGGNEPSSNGSAQLQSAGVSQAHSASQNGDIEKDSV